MKVSIIGGSGKMGQLVAHFLSKNHHNVSTVGRQTRNFKKTIETSDAILFSLPLKAFDETVTQLRGVSLKNKLLIDLSSNVGANTKKLSLLSPSVAFLHLLFGPDIYNLKGHHIVTSKDANTDKRLKAIVDIFKKEGATIITSSAEHHDTMMAYTQALSQFNSILLAKTLAESGPSSHELKDFATLTFSLNTEVISRIFHQNAELWAAIQFTNEYFPEIIERHQKNMALLAELVQNRDYRKFANIFNEVASFWKSDHIDTFTLKEVESVTSFKKGGVGVLGPEGTFSHQAVLKYNKTLRPVFFDTIADVVNALAAGEVGEALVPFENSIEGTVRETLDGLYRNRLAITSEIVVDIRQCIAGIEQRATPGSIEYIYSHPQALAQCRAYIYKNYPRAKLVLTPSTSAAFQKIKNEAIMHARAIGPRLAATTNKLSVIDENIQDKDNNRTLFVVISRPTNKPSRLKSTLFVIDPKTDKPGLLHAILGVFAGKKVNLSKIESRPSQSRLGKYVFYLKADIRKSDEKFKKIVKELGLLGHVTILSN